MVKSKRQTFGAFGLALGLAVLCFMLILTALHNVGTDGELYYRLQTEAGIQPSSGISDDDLRALDGELASYLAGRPNELVLPLDSEPGAYTVYTAVVNGEMTPVFNEREMTHLEDCRRLFELLRKVRRRLIPWVVLLIVGGAYLLQNRKAARRAALASPLVLLIPLGAFALWAAIDFDGAFTFFHRVLFDNDLWLLDPRTDLLIRICPESMFMAMGRTIALRGLAILVGVPAAAVGLTLVWPKSKQKEETTWNANRATRRGAACRPKTFDVKGKR